MAKDPTVAGKPGLELFFKKLDYRKVPERGASLFRRDIDAEKRVASELDRLEHELEVLQAPLWKAQLEVSGLSIATLREAKTKTTEFLQAHQEKTKAFYRSGGDGYGYLPPDTRFADILTAAGQMGLCRDVTVIECQERVCIDQPVALTVDDAWLTSGTDGTLRWPRQYDRFQLSDSVRGGDSWNFTYHRIKHTHDGEINFRAGTELVEQSTVRSIGVRFEPLPSGNYGGQQYFGYNGGHAEGMQFAALPDNWGQCQQWISFQVSARTPGGTWTAYVPWNMVKVRYKDTGRIVNRIYSSPPFYPPERQVALNQTFPSGTQLLIDLSLSYQIVGNGLDGSAWVDYMIEVQPYVNLEACSWQWPAR